MKTSNESFRENLAIGDEVAFSAEFCRSIFDYFETPHYRGKVTGFYNEAGPKRFAYILWTHETKSKLVATANLAKPGPDSRFAAC